MIKNKRIGFIGVGNMAQGIIRALIESGTVAGQDILATNRSPRKLQKMVEAHGITAKATNEELIEASDVIVIAIKPQDMVQSLESIGSAFHSGHVVMSLAAGLDLKSLKKLLPNVSRLVRVMPSIGVSVRQSVIGYAMVSPQVEVKALVENLFSPVGLVVPVEEGEAFEALTVACSSGIGFVFELMEYWQEWLEEYGFAPELSRQMTVRTFLGASLLASLNPDTTLQDLQHKVASKKGVTAAGLDSLRELEVERLLRYSFEKAVLRDRELGKG